MPVYPDYSHGLATTMVSGQPVLNGRPRLEDLPSDRYQRVNNHAIPPSKYVDYGDHIQWIDKSTGEFIREDHLPEQHTAWIDPIQAETHGFVPADPAYLRAHGPDAQPQNPPRSDMGLYYVSPPDNTTVRDPAPEQAVLAQGDASAARMSRNSEPVVNPAVPEAPRHIPLYNWNVLYDAQRDQPYDDGRRGTNYTIVKSWYPVGNRTEIKTVPKQDPIPPQRRYVDPTGIYNDNTPFYLAHTLPEAMEIFSRRGSNPGYAREYTTPGEEIPYDTTVYYGRR